MDLARGSRFIGLVWESTAIEATAQVRTRFERLTEGWCRATPAPGVVLCAERAEYHAASDTGALCMASRQVVDTRARRAHDAASLLAAVAREGPRVLAGLAPPFALAWSSGASSRLEAWADPFGIGQLFHVSVGSAAAVSNSAALLAKVFGCGLDAEALIGFSLFGAFQESDTPFLGVDKLVAGSMARLSPGRCELIEGPPAPPRRAAGEAPSVAQLAGIVRDTAAMLSDAMPDADLQLSGGLDSRVILAALPPDRRRRHRVVTIGGADSPDVRIASAITASLGLSHEVIDTGGLETLSADTLHAVLSAAVTGYDFASNPVDKVTLMLANRSMAGGSCFNGQNGEILRGFYFPGQPLGRRPDEGLARALIGWRLESNDVAAARLFRTDLYATHKARAEDRVVARLVSLGQDWASALDRYYLYERMQRWGGNGLGNFNSDRVYLCPFFDPEFVASALALPAVAKTNSRGAFALLAALDRGLASVPLDSGLTPLKVVEAPLAARIAEGGYILKKATARVTRKLQGTGRGTLGSATVGELWHRHRLFERLPADDLAATGLFDPEALAALLSGEWAPDRPTLGFMLTVAELARRS